MVLGTKVKVQYTVDCAEDQCQLLSTNTSSDCPSPFLTTLPGIPDLGSILGPVVQNRIDLYQD